LHESRVTEESFLSSLYNLLNKSGIKAEVTLLKRELEISSSLRVWRLKIFHRNFHSPPTAPRMRDRLAERLFLGGKAAA
jgi:hypothetical protein